MLTFETLMAMGEVEGEWTSDCDSTNQSGSYARFYTFTLEEETKVTIDLTSEEDTYLFLLDGADKDVEFRFENDDVSDDDRNSRISEALEAGTYTVEATTYSGGRTGEFTLSITGPGGDTETPAPTPTDSCVDDLGTLTGAVSQPGTWADDCDSTNRSGSYARFYTFTLEEETKVTIELTSEEDTYLFLLDGADKDVEFRFENDDVSDDDRNSRISEALEAGTYTVEATTYSAGVTGDFTLTIAGPGGSTPMDSCVQDLGALSGTVTETGSWANDCDSTNREGRYARFYTFTLEEETEVTVDLTSTEDPYLFLLDGAGRDGTVNEDNDDIETGINNNSRIVEILEAGAYTIEATTYDEEITGEFTLTVSG